MAAPASMAGAVVFGLPHLRQAIFAAHAQLIDERRKEVLGAIERPNASQFGGYLSYDSYPGNHPRTFFACALNFLRQDTTLFDIFAKLGLQNADWLDLLLDRPVDVNQWAAAYTSIERREKTKASDLQAHPQAKAGSGAAHEHPTANPMEMFLYSVLTYGYSRNSELEGAERHAVGSLLRDVHGRTYLMDIADGLNGSFMIEAASKCPDLIYGSNSPFWPVYESFFYRESRDVGAVISQTPPWPFVRRLAPGVQRQDELRRILERARDLFSHLVTLEKHGVSLDGQMMHKDWHYALAYKPSDPAQGGPWLIPAYLEHLCTPQEEGKLARLGHFVEKLPPAPQDAWPGAGAETSMLPWSQYSAYCDPRVPGPRTYIYGLTSGSFTDESFKRRMTGRKAKPPSATTTTPFAKPMPSSRYHEDLINVAEHVVESFFQTSSAGTAMTQAQRVELLESTLPSEAYEAAFRAPIPSIAGPSSLTCSPLFFFCPSCARKGPEGFPPLNGRGTFYEGRCTVCYASQVVTAMPPTVRHLLLRILRPSKDADGKVVVVTAKEAHDTLEVVLESEGPRLASHYQAWCEAQKRVVRLEHPRDLSLPVIEADDSAHRLLMIEHLRGRHLEHSFRRNDFNRTRLFIRNELSDVQKKKLVELRAACGDKEAAAALATKIEKDEEEKAAAAATALVVKEEEEAEASSSKAPKAEDGDDDEWEPSGSSKKKKGKRTAKGGASSSSKGAKKAKK